MKSPWLFSLGGMIAVAGLLFSATLRSQPPVPPIASGLKVLNRWVGILVAKNKAGTVYLDISVRETRRTAN